MNFVQQCLILLTHTSQVSMFRYQQLCLTLIPPPRRSDAIPRLPGSGPDNFWWARPHPLPWRPGSSHWRVPSEPQRLPAGRRRALLQGRETPGHDAPSGALHPGLAVALGPEGLQIFSHTFTMVTYVHERCCLVQQHGVIILCLHFWCCQRSVTVLWGCGSTEAVGALLSHVMHLLVTVVLCLFALLQGLL